MLRPKDIIAPLTYNTQKVYKHRIYQTVNSKIWYLTVYNLDTSSPSKESSLKIALNKSPNRGGGETLYIFYLYYKKFYLASQRGGGLGHS